MPSPNCPDQIKEIPYLLTPEQASDAIEACRPYLTPALVGRGEGRVQHPARVADNFKVRVDAPWSMKLRTTAAMLADVPLDYVEPVEIIRYQKGGYYYKHTDGIDRTHTLHVSLSTDFKGGELFFNNLGAIFERIPVGVGLWFEVSGMAHECRPITEGEKWIAIAWVSKYNSVDRVNSAATPQLKDAPEPEPAPKIILPN